MTALIATLVICGVLVFTYYIKSGHFLSSFFKGTVLGVCVLCMVVFLGHYVHLSIPLNYTTLSVSAILGIPGVALLLISKYFI